MVTPHPCFSWVVPMQTVGFSAEKRRKKTEEKGEKTINPYQKPTTEKKNNNFSVQMRLTLPRSPGCATIKPTALPS